VLFAAVPEATVNEHREAHTGESNVRSNPTLTEIQAKMFPKSKASAMQRGAKGNLWLRIATAIRSHGRRSVCTSRNGYLLHYQTIMPSCSRCRGPRLGG
jgi:hypothetical protein